MTLRAELRALEAADDLARLEGRVGTAGEVFAVAAECARGNGPALLFADAPGRGRPVAGVRGGPDRTVRRDRLPRSRIAGALGLGRDAGYVAVLDRLAAPEGPVEAPEHRPLAADPVDAEPTDLALPRPGSGARPAVTGGLVAAETEGGTRWAPVRGTVRQHDSLRVAVPEGFAGAASGGAVRLAMGVPTAAAAAARIAAAGGIGWPGRAPEIAAGLGEVAVAAEAGAAVPASAEVVLSADATGATAPPEGPAARWEATVPTAGLDLSVTGLATREDPLIPAVPVGEPLADDVHLAGLVEAARLQARVDGYWGVSPVEWVALPVEAGLGLCVVASELLYAGFEWQLANTLFAYADAFDKVLVLDAGTPPDDLGRALDDLWVKAHPARDWTFGEPQAPAPTATAYRTDGRTGTRLYVNAAWDPSWEEEYIAPPVSFEATYDEELRRAVTEQWETLGFE